MHGFEHDFRQRMANFEYSRTATKRKVFFGRDDRGSRFLNETVDKLHQLRF
jgi:hypothetical protein